MSCPMVAGPALYHRGRKKAGLGDFLTLRTGDSSFV